MPSADSSTVMASRHAQSSSGRASPDVLPTAFVANHHRAHNPDDPKLLASNAIKSSKRSSIFGGIIKPKQPKARTGSKLPKAPSTSSGLALGDGGSGLDIETLGPAASPWSRRGHGGTVAAPRERTSSRTRRHSTGPVLTRSAADLQADAQRQQMPDLPGRFLKQAGQTPNQADADAQDVLHDKVVSGDSRPPSDLIREDVLVAGHTREASEEAAMLESSTAVVNESGQVAGTPAPSASTPAEIDSPPIGARSKSLPRFGGNSGGSPRQRIADVFADAVPSSRLSGANGSPVLAAPATTLAGQAGAPASPSFTSSPSQTVAVPTRTNSRVVASPLIDAVCGASASRRTLTGEEGQLSASASSSLAPPAPPTPGSSSLALGIPASPARPSGPVSIRALRESITPRTASRTVTGSASTTAARMAGVSLVADGPTDNGKDEHSSEDLDDLDLVPRPKKRSALSMIDFLNSEPPPGGSPSTSRPRSSFPPPPPLQPGQAAEQAPISGGSAAATSTNVPASMPLMEAVRDAERMHAASIAPLPISIEARRRSSGNITLPPQGNLAASSSAYSSRRASAIPMSTSSLSQGLDGEQGMSPSPTQPFLRQQDATIPQSQRNGARTLGEPLPIVTDRSAGKMKQADEGVDTRSAPHHAPSGSARTASPQPMPRVRPIDLGAGVSLSVEPLTDDIVMFGSTQTSSNYSLSGAVVLTIPRPALPTQRAGLGSEGHPSSVVSHARAASIDGQASPTKTRYAPSVHRHTASLANSPAARAANAGRPSLLSPNSAVARSSASLGAHTRGSYSSFGIGEFGTSPVEQGDFLAVGSWSSDASPARRRSSGAGEVPSPSPLTRPSVKVESLTVTFSGFAMYADASGRFNAIRLATISQELLQNGGCTCYADADEATATAHGVASPLHAHTTSESSSVKYDIEFDLSVPGWLPGSLRSRFGGTFYCLQATAIVDGRQVMATASSPSPGGATGLPYAAGSGTLFSDPFAPQTFSVPRSASDVFEGADDIAGGRSAPATLRSTMRSATDPQGSVASSTKSERPKSSWLSKRAKQLQLRTPRKAGSSHESGAEGSKSARDRSRGRDGASSQAELLAMEENGVGRASNEVAEAGKRRVQSGAITIVVRRCRDVVPVPVARMALIGTDPGLSGLAIPPVPPIASALAAAATLASPSALAGTTSDLATLPSAPPPAPSRPPAEASLVQSASGDSFVTAAAGTPPVSPSPSGTLNSDARPAAATAQPATAAALAPAAQILPRHLASGLDGRFASSNGTTTASSSTTCPDSAGSTSGATPSLAAPTTARRTADAMFPPAPSAFDVPSDPAKQAAALSAMASSPSASSMGGQSGGVLPRSTTAASLSSDIGNARSPPRTSSRGASSSRSSAPMRHFLHRPVLYPPAEFGIFGSGGGSDGLPFSLTLSLPSHVQVSGPKSDTLSFGVQIEVSKSDGWNMVRQLGGLRLRDMELVCLQTERHSSVPSRTFCATFPVPPAPNKVAPSEVPILAPSTKRSDQMSTMTGTEARLRLGYDRDLVLNHLSLVRRGVAPDPLENNVERTRTTIVGPPPPPPPPPNADEAGPSASGKGLGKKGKDKLRDKGKGRDRRANDSDADASRRGPLASSSRPGPAAPARSLTGSGTPAASDVVASRAARPQTSSSSLRARFASGTFEPGLAPPLPGQDARPPSPFGPPSRSPSSSLAPAGAAAAAAAAPTSAVSPRPDTSSTAADGPNDVRGSTYAAAEANDAYASGGQRGPSRGRRAYANALSRLSTFASSMLDPGLDHAPGSGGGDGSADGRNNERSGTSHTMGEQGMSEDASSRATYVFSGEDGEGVDLTRGRVRMTINLPLASSNASLARSKGCPQLIPDFESPYARIRHKLKVKLGFGLSHRSGVEEQSWSQALVMCVPVRFTESPPKEVQDQFAPITVQPLQPVPRDDGAGGAASRPEGSRAGGPGGAGAPSALSTSFVPVLGGASESAGTNASGIPLLPAYTQLFREDGSRLADEGEDLPQYPGRMSVIGEIDVDERDTPSAQTTATAAAPRSPALASSSAIPTIQEDEAGEASTVEADRDARDAMSGDEMAAHRPSVNGGGREYFGMAAASSSARPGLSAASHDMPNNVDGGNGVTASFSYASLFAEALERGGAVAVPTPMDRSTSLPGRRGLVRGSSSLSPLKSSASNSVLGSQAALGAGVPSGRPQMRQRSATSASIVTFSRIVPSEVLDEALLVNTMEDEEARRDAARVAADGLDDDDDDDDDDDGADGNGDVVDDEDDDDLSMGEGVTDAETSDAHLPSGRSSGEQGSSAGRPSGGDASRSGDGHRND